MNLTVSWAERIRLTGPNGSGKSTLVEGLRGRLAPASGVRAAGSAVVIGELDQTRRVFGGDRSVLDIVRDHLAIDVRDLRAVGR